MNIKLFFIFVLLLIMKNTVNAQVSVGVKTVPLIPNGSSLTGTFENKTANKGSDDYRGYLPIINFGITIDYFFQNPFSLHTELNYKIQGYQDIAEFEIFALNYIEIPLLFRYQRGDNIKFFIQAGPSLKFLSQATHDYRKQNVKYKSTITDIYSSSVLVGNLGLGISYEISERMTLNSEFRFGYDLTQTVKSADNVLLDSGDTWTFNNTHLTQAAITIGVSYKLKSTNR